MEILYTSGDVHKAIKKIFSSPCKRRVAVVAYLGVNAENYLPNPKNLEIVCCPEPGATSPRAVRALIDRGAIIQFSEGLHSKVYWSNKGCVITSANISHRALGNAPQKEAGIFLDSSALDIDRLISESKPFKITQAIMDKLEKLDRKIKRDNEVKTQNSTKTEFDDWYNSPYREPWKINWYDSEIALAKNAKNKSIEEYNVKEPSFVTSVSQKQASSHEWFLCFETTASGIKNLEWMYVDFVVPVNVDDKKAYQKEYPFQAIQVPKLSQYPHPPFFLSKEFKAAFKKAAKEYGVEKIENSSTLKVSMRLLELTNKYFANT